ncbi:MAG: hypothetical protein KF795_19395 [Labilithrix sp.]|nr:hypothetical protein [Labilithrix sp.]
MRKLTSLLVPAPLALFALFACEQDSSSGGGALPLVDASLADYTPPPPFDANAPETATDLPVTVTITGRDGPKASVRVVFHDAAGAILETKVTGADGKATSSGTPAMVSALLELRGAREIVTWTGVEAGDQLAIRDPGAQEPLGTLDVALPGPFGNAVEYVVKAGQCNALGDAEGASLTLYPRCVGGQAAVLAFALSSGGTVDGVAFAKGKSFPSDGGAAAVATGDWQVPGTFELTVLNPPADAFLASELTEIVDGVGYSDPPQTGQGTTYSFKTAPGFADAYQVSTGFSSASTPRKVIKRLGPAATASLDAATLLPPITATSLDATDPRRPVLGWTSPSTAGADGGIVQIGYADALGGSAFWTFVVPPGSKSVTAPAMPADVGGFLPGGADVFYGGPRVLFIEADVLPSYASFRRQPGSLVDVLGGTFDLPVVPVNGTFRLTGFIAQPG